MKVVDRCTLADGTEIQLEYWSEHNTEEFPDLYGLTIVAYPIAKNTGKYGWIKGGERFRLGMSYNKYCGYMNEDVKRDYERLKNGEITLLDLSDHFNNRDKDKWYLGMDVEYQGW